MKHKIKMIALDLDGTLLDSKKEISERTRRTLAEAAGAGAAIVVSTGRPLNGLPKSVLSLKGVRYLLTSNGARIFDMQEERTLYEKLVPYAQAERVLEIFSRFDALEEIYYDGKGYADKTKLADIERYMPDYYLRRYILSTRVAVDSIDALFAEKGLGVDKMQGIFTSVEEKDRAKKMIREDPKLCDLELTGALIANIEVNAAGVSKGDGLLRLGERLGIRREEIMACGDGDNDVTMMKTAGLAVAMENGCPETLEAADYVTASNDEDGVAKAVERFVLDRADGGR